MDFKLSIDDQDLVDGITFARERDNTAKSEKDAVASNEEWLEIEVMHLLKQTCRQKCESEAQAASAKIMAEFEKKMASKS